MADSQILLIIGLLLLVVGLVGVAAEFFGASIGPVAGRARIGAVLLGLVLLAAWFWLPLPGSRQAAAEADYQDRVLATCDDVKNEQFGDTGFRGDHYEIGPLVASFAQQLEFAEISFDELWDESVPGSLEDERDRANRDVDRVLASSRQLLERLRDYPSSTIAVAEFQGMASELDLTRLGARAKGSLTDLAGERCGVYDES